MFTTLFQETNGSDDVFEAWELAARDARLSWDTWQASDAAERGDAYARYRASLDREERAAELLEASVRSGRRRARR